MFFIPLAERNRLQEESSRDYFIDKIQSYITRATITKLD